MREPRRKTLSFLAAIAIPLTQPTGWQNLPFDKIPPNKVQFTENGLQIAVNQSASPLIYPLPQPKKIRGFKARVFVTGEMNASSGPWDEDSYLRVGFVSSGSRRLGFLEKLAAARWVKKLFELAPPGSGIDKISFYCVGSGKMILGAHRVHPKSKLLEEFMIANKHAGREPIILHHTFSEPKDVVAIWLSTDGDDTQSVFSIEIRSLELIE